MKNDNVGKCGHAKCAGGELCYEKGKPMQPYRTVSMTKMEKVTPATQEEARAHAIEWQQWASEQNLSYGELAEWQSHFEQLAEEFDLHEEFIENGIL